MEKLETLLLIEDDKVTRHCLRENLEKSGYVIIEASHGGRGLDILRQHHISLVLLDLNLQNENGADLIPIIRGLTYAPILMVSGENDKQKKINSIEAGADDFIAKPVDYDMLAAKVKAHLRRAAYRTRPKNTSQLLPSQPSHEKLRFGPWLLDIDKYQVMNDDGTQADLTSREIRLLFCLLSNADRAVSRSTLCEAIRERNYVPSSRAIDVKITRIRKKIGDDASSPRYITTVRGIGYMMRADRDRDGDPTRKEGQRP